LQKNKGGGKGGTRELIKNNKKSLIPSTGREVKKLQQARTAEGGSVKS